MPKVKSLTYQSLINVETPFYHFCLTVFFILIMILSDIFFKIIIFNSYIVDIVFI